MFTDLWKPIYFNRGSCTSGGSIYSVIVLLFGTRQEYADCIKLYQRHGRYHLIGHVPSLLPLTIISPGLTMAESIVDTDTVLSNSAEIATAPTTPEVSAHHDSISEADDASYSKLSPEDSDTEAPIQPRTIRNICFVGAGYVGGPTAALMALNNPHITVTVVDKDDRRIRRWNSRHLPIYEPGLAEIARVARDGLQEGTDGQAGPQKPNLIFSTDVSRCINDAEIVVIAVNTPTKMRGAGKGSATDMTSFEAVAGEVVRHARDGTIIVEKSTVPCRTAEMIEEMVR